MKCPYCSQPLTTELAAHIPACYALAWNCIEPPRGTRHKGKLKLPIAEKRRPARRIKAAG